MLQSQYTISIVVTISVYLLKSQYTISIVVTISVYYIHILCYNLSILYPHMLQSQYTISQLATSTVSVMYWHVSDVVY